MIRDRIKAAIRARGDTIYGFTKRQKIMHPVSMRMYLYSNRSISPETLEKIMKLLGIEKKTTGENGKKRQPKKDRKATGVKK